MSAPTSATSVPVPTVPARVAITGASGFVGSALTATLRATGSEVIPVVRREARRGEIRWDPAGGWIDADAFTGIDAVVHLAGENAAGRWSEAKKRRIRESRVQGTRLLSVALAKMARPPGVYVCASAMGFYGDRGDEILAEDAPHGSGFMAEVVRDWEEATLPARKAGIRTTMLRTGLVLDGSGGLLGRILPVFRLGLGARLGDGRQWMSWIALPDLIGAIRVILDEPHLAGPVNTVSPEPVRNGEFTQTLAEVLGRPAVMTAPAFALRLLLSEFADEAMLASIRLTPARLQQEQFPFAFPFLKPALTALLARPPG